MVFIHTRLVWIDALNASRCWGLLALSFKDSVWSIWFLVFISVWWESSDLISWLHILRNLFLFIFILHNLGDIGIKHVILPWPLRTLRRKWNLSKRLRTCNLGTARFKFLYIFQNLFENLWLNCSLLAFTARRASFSFMIFRI